MKRGLDILAAGFGLLLCSPLLVLVALAVWIEDRHSPFYFGRRCARGGGLFSMVKFRSMVPNAWKTGVSSTAAGDRRVTRVGCWIRRGKLDELPQLWNVLVGDMSLVGPRPQVEADASLYTEEEQHLLSVRPGVTDLASIVFADEGDVLAGADDPDLLYNQIIRPWKSRLGLLYIQHQSLGLDLQLIGWTIWSAVARRQVLASVDSLLESWGAEPLLRRMAARREPLLAWAPPGATEIVQRYPGQAAHV
jgi:lipopolysaccharide/colanic/teichoic acid biosynthesis glycosyltransferase